MLEIGGNGKLVASLSAACVGGIFGGIMWAKAQSRKDKDPLPEKWIRVGTVKELIIYPVKSLQGISLPEAVATPIGLRGNGADFLRDRVFLIADSTGKTFYTLRHIPRMAFIQPSISGNILTLEMKDGSDDMIEVQIPTDKPEIRKSCRIWKNTVTALDCGDAVSTWLSKVMNTSGLRLYYHNEDKSQRTVSPEFKMFPGIEPTHTGAFSDETSYMLMTDESVAAVNSQLEDTKAVSHQNFRPGIVVEGVPEPFAEDFWSFVRIGPTDTGAVFKISMPCARCKLTTVDHEKGDFRDDNEPLATIRKMKRQVGNQYVNQLVAKQAIMGAHMGLHQGTNTLLKVGDPVYAALL